jgi:holo-[acyl-carrier protein] synthase
MIQGIGTDLVLVERVKQALQRHGERFAERILAEEEMLEFKQARDPGRYLAKRFAVKEAAAKALGTGFQHGIRFIDIRTTHSDLGQPLLEFRGEAQKRCEALAVKHSHVSISDDGAYAIAFVTLLRDRQGDVAPF